MTLQYVKQLQLYLGKAKELRENPTVVTVCNLDKEFHLSYLFDESVERDGVSPVRMMGIYDEEELKSKLIGLSSAYPEFINATFTNDLKTVTLRDKTSNDVLELFKEDM